MDARLKVMWGKETLVTKMARDLGVSQSTVSVRAKRLGLPSRWTQKRRDRQERRITSVMLMRAHLSFVEGLNEQELWYYNDAAARRRISAVELTAKILSYSIRDRMIDSIIDDLPTSGVHAEARL